MKRKNNIKRCIVAMAAIFVACFGILPVGRAYADTEFTVTPMKQKIILMPGEVYEGSFGVTNPASSTKDFNYELSVRPFSVDDTNKVIFENEGDYNQIVDWIKLESKEGTVKPNSTKTIHFTIDTPKDAPSGGQYATIVVTNADTEEASGSVNIQNVLSISHLLFAEVAGSTNKNGDILSADVPGFLLSGNISGNSIIKNNGNVHGTATYTLQVFPLFSNEEIYSNEEAPEEHFVMPGHEYFNTINWDQTPGIGIFNVKYTVEFEGTKSEVSKMVIVCPLWLLFIIIFIIVGAILWLIMRARARKKETANAA